MTDSTKYEQCPRCFGRGYQPEPRKSGMGFYARLCPRCAGRGETPAKPAPSTT